MLFMSGNVDLYPILYLFHVLCTTYTRASEQIIFYFSNRYVGKAAAGSSTNFWKRSTDHLKRAFIKCADEDIKRDSKGLEAALRVTKAKDWKISILEIVKDKEQLGKAETKWKKKRGSMFPAGLNFI